MRRRRQTEAEQARKDRDGRKRKDCKDQRYELRTLLRQSAECAEFTEGVNAKVNGSRDVAVIKADREISNERIKEVIAELGYAVAGIEEK